MRGQSQTPKLSKWSSSKKRERHEFILVGVYWNSTIWGIQFGWLVFVLRKIVWDFVVSPFWEHSLVKIHEHTILTLNDIIELTFHVTMSSQSFSYVTMTAPFGSQLYRLKPIDVLCFEIKKIYLMKNWKENKSLRNRSFSISKIQQLTRFYL